MEKAEKNKKMAFRTKNVALRYCTGYFYEGKEIVLRRKQGKPFHNQRYKYDFWPTEKKVEAATVFAVVKNVKKTAEITGIPMSAIKKFQQDPFFDNVVQNVYQQKNEELDNYLTEIVHKAAEVIKDRLENGEAVVTKDGKVFERPISAREATHVLGTAFDKRQLLRGEATSRSESVSGGDRLKDLQARFEALAQSKGINPHSEPIEGESHEHVQGAGEGEEDQSQTPSEGEEPSEGQVSESPRV